MRATHRVILDRLVLRTGWHQCRKCRAGNKDGTVINRTWSARSPFKDSLVQGQLLIPKTSLDHAHIVRRQPPFPFRPDPSSDMA